jgi:hypothetical protein
LVLDGTLKLGRRTSSPGSGSEDPIQDIGSGENSAPQTPKESRKRFALGFFASKTPTSSTANQGTPIVTSEATPATGSETPMTTGTPVGSTTPTKSSLRSRVMERFMGKSPAGSTSSPIPIQVIFVLIGARVVGLK